MGELITCGHCKTKYNSELPSCYVCKKKSNGPAQEIPPIGIGPDVGCGQCNPDEKVKGSWMIGPWYEKYKKYFAPLSEVKKLKLGRLFSCKHCNALWLLTEDSLHLKYIPYENIDLFNEWSNKELRFSEQILSKLKEIGAQPVDLYGNGLETVCFPCSARCQKGEVLEYCVIVFTMTPPVFDYPKYENFVWANEIIDVWPSEYVLPRELRIEASRAEEVRMGYMPSVISDPEGYGHIINGHPCFIKIDNYKGSEFRQKASLKGASYLGAKEPAVKPDYKHKEIKWVIADWNENVADMRLIVPEYQKILNAIFDHLEEGHCNRSQLAQRLTISQAMLAGMRGGSCRPQPWQVEVMKKYCAENNIKWIP